MTTLSYSAPTTELASLLAPGSPLPDDDVYDIALELDRRGIEATSPSVDDEWGIQPVTVCRTAAIYERHSCCLAPEDCDPVDLELMYDPDEPDF